MSHFLLRFSTALLIFLFSSAALANDCYVIGDTGNNVLSKPLGSRQNPHGSLAGVQGDPGCETITVVYSGVVLDGGIALADGQRLKGQTGPGEALPIISNTTGANGGNGVLLGANNSVDGLHITNVQNSGVSGADVGDLAILNSLITGFALNGEVVPGPGAVSFLGFFAGSGIAVSASDDVKIRISDTEIGEADTSSISILTLDGHADVVIENVSVRDQSVTAGTAGAWGIGVLSFGTSSVDLKVQNTSVSNIGSGFCNCDGMLFLALEKSAMDVIVDGYSYVNPDGDGGGSATGLEIGLFFGVGASVDAAVRNSTFTGGSTVALQIIDQQPGNNNYLTVHIHDNEIYAPAGSGIEIDVGNGASFGTDFITIEDNAIVNTGGSGIVIASIIEPQTVLNVLLQGNSIMNAGKFGFEFAQVVGASAASLNLDAGLGSLGSKGKNRIINSQLGDILVEAFDCCGFPPTPPFTVDAANNWWGSSTGPATVLELGGATVDVTPFLTRDPGGN